VQPKKNVSPNWKRSKTALIEFLRKKLDGSPNKNIHLSIDLMGRIQTSKKHKKLQMNGTMKALTNGNIKTPCDTSKLREWTNFISKNYVIIYRT